MAIDATKPIPSQTASRESRLNASDIAATMLAPLASLKLTVVLLVLAVVVIFIATIDQTRHDIWDVKNKHFESVLVQVPFQTFFVPRWFPAYQNVPGAFYIPSGITILVLMLVNLTAAHLMRFRLQASGLKLVVGTVAALLAAGLTWAVIFNNQNPDGFQAQPPISFSKMWIILQISVLAMACSAAFGFFTIDRQRVAERILLMIAAITCGGLLVVTMLLGEKSFIGDSAMRILWQLAQATVAAAASLAACMLLFRRKAGIVLLHIGIAGLMFNEIYVTVTNQEQRMTIMEGETVSQAVDVRATELAIIDVSDPEIDEITVVPGSKLKSGEQISDDQLPFDVRCIRYMSNSDIREVRDASENLATIGVGKRVEAVELPITTGTDSEQKVDFASAYVELTDKKTNASLGTHLVSQNIDVKSSDTITVDDKPYRIDLRFKTDYKPFSMTLVDVKADYYLGTETPRWYSSDVVLNNPDSGVSSTQEIWMNNPLRYADETFYQSSLGTLPSGEEYTVLQVVKNKGWMIPYVCCMFTVLGLVSQFGSSLLGYLEKKRKPDSVVTKEIPPEIANSAAVDTPSASPARWRDWIPTAILVGFFAVYIAGEFAKTSRPIEKNGLRLDLLGQIPVTKDGRVQPLDSFARNTARQLSKRETIKDGNDEGQSAIRWLADTIFEAPGYEDYRLFRIEDPSILTALELPIQMPTPERDKNRFRYTFAEVLEAEPTLMSLLPDSEKVDPNTWSVFQKRLSNVATKLQRVFGAKLTFGSPVDETETNLMARLEKAGKSISSPLIPLVIPTNNPEKPWESFMVLQNQQWLGELATEYNVETTDQLASQIIETQVVPTAREDMIKDRILRRLLSDPGFRETLEKELGETDPRKLAEMMDARWDDMPKEIFSGLVAIEKPMVDALLEQQRPRFEKIMAEQIAKVNGGAGQISRQLSETSSLLMELRQAYQDGDAEKFNSSLETYLEIVRSDPPTGMSNFKLDTEKTYMGFAPFYLAMVIYLFAFLVGTLGWIGWPVAWNRASFWLLMLGLTIHIGGLVARVIISGRPPVTNLYSSALFVSAVFVVCMLLVERITKIGLGNVLAGLGAFAALMWAWSMSIVDGDTFTVLVAVLDTQFWLSTHVTSISIGYAVTFVAGFLGMAYVLAALVTPALHKKVRRDLANVIYGVVCFGLLFSFFGTVLGGLWADDSWGRFWGWDPKENGALMIVLWCAVILHARWGGMIRERGLAALAIIGNLITLWSWKGVNAMGVGLHAYAGTEDTTMKWILFIGQAHVVILLLAMIPTKYWMSYAVETRDPAKKA